MKEIKFNIPLKLAKSIENVKKFLAKKSPLHGPGENIYAIKNEVRKKFKFKNVYLTNSCTSALEIAALAINLKKNDEVIVPSFAFITSASSFARTGCKIRFCDIQENNLMPSFKQIVKCVNKKTKAIIIMHYQGYSVNYLNELKKFCNKKKIFLIEDAAQAFGSFFKKKALGSFGDFACFSFHETKNIHSGSGGMLVVNNKKFIEKTNAIFDKGTNRYLMEKNKVKYYSWITIGSAFLMSELSASYLLPQIINYKKIFYERSKIYLNYLKKLKVISNGNFTLTNSFKYKYNYHAFVIILKKNEREKFLKYLNKFNIKAVISYTELHKSKKGKTYFKKSDKLVNTEFLVKRIVRLPLHNYLSSTEVNYISSKIKNYFS